MSRKILVADLLCGVEGPRSRNQNSSAARRCRVNLIQSCCVAFPKNTQKKGRYCREWI
jgi:hypothetical protein